MYGTYNSWNFIFVITAHFDFYVRINASFRLFASILFLDLILDYVFLPELKRDLFVHDISFSFHFLFYFFTFKSYVICHL